MRRSWGQVPVTMVLPRASPFASSSGFALRAECLPHWLGAVIAGELNRVQSGVALEWPCRVV